MKTERQEAKADLIAAAKERYLKEFDSALAQSYDMGVRDGLDMIAEAIKSMTSPDTDAAFKERVSEALKKLKAE